MDFSYEKLIYYRAVQNTYNQTGVFRFSVEAFTVDHLIYPLRLHGWNIDKNEEERVSRGFHMESRKTGSHYDYIEEKRVADYTAVEVEDFTYYHHFEISRDLYDESLKYVRLYEMSVTDLDTLHNMLDRLYHEYYDPMVQAVKDEVNARYAEEMHEAQLQLDRENYEYVTLHKKSKRQAASSKRVFAAVLFVLGIIATGILFLFIYLYNYTPTLKWHLKLLITLAPITFTLINLIIVNAILSHNPYNSLDSVTIVQKKIDKEIAIGVAHIPLWEIDHDLLQRFKIAMDNLKEAITKLHWDESIIKQDYLEDTYNTEHTFLVNMVINSIKRM